ncbi:AMIN domain-containing protein [Calothrix sp. UHCC 0171]|uniref:AMIN domain-containing protein n=1 Tax=Calothrix sp. UHCC 0171 TaxID=3110245 RepID=UPI002B1F62C7|nr:AMIN domain-containing protein [Calothrix sp. UHCC 0171]MEA5571886.1 AMIN domain-containing protein [Calothrix sp. UHCC 0171]
MINTVANQQLLEIPQPNRKHLYQKLFSVSIFSVFSLCGALSLPNIHTAIAQNSQLQEWQFFPEFAQLEFTLSAASQPKVFYLSQPSRLVLDIPNTKLGFVPTRQNYNGAIQSIRVSQLKAQTNITRIVLDFAPGTTFNPNQVLLQPVSTNRWVLRPFVTSYNPNVTPQGYFPPQSNNYQPATQTPQTQTNLPPAVYAPQAPSNNLPGFYPPQPTGTLPSTLGNSSLPPVTNNITNSIQQPFVSVPPLNSNNTSQIPGSILPPASFPNLSGGFNNPPPLINPNSVTTYPNSVNSDTNPGIIPLPWGQSIPNQGQ